jgi:hypothetical protein
VARRARLLWDAGSSKSSFSETKTMAAGVQSDAKTKGRARVRLSSLKVGPEAISPSRPDHNRDTERPGCGRDEATSAVRIASWATMFRPIRSDVGAGRFVGARVGLETSEAVPGSACSLWSARRARTSPVNIVGIGPTLGPLGEQLAELCAGASRAPGRGAGRLMGARRPSFALRRQHGGDRC